VRTVLPDGEKIGLVTILRDCVGEGEGRHGTPSSVRSFSARVARSIERMV
jgi:hypothetical protein